MKLNINKFLRSYRHILVLVFSCLSTYGRHNATLCFTSYMYPHLRIHVHCRSRLHLNRALHWEDHKKVFLSITSEPFSQLYWIIYKVQIKVSFKYLLKSSRLSSFSHTHVYVVCIYWSITLFSAFYLSWVWPSTQ